MNLKQMLKKKFFNADGTINKTVVASFITLLIVLIQQIMLACGFSYGHWDQVASIINTILTILGLCGFVEGNGEVTTSTIEQTANGLKVTIASGAPKKAKGITSKDFPTGSSIMLNSGKVKLNADKVKFDGKNFIPNQPQGKGDSDETKKD
ncbi:MAG TPA: hypothetical protein H9720_01085 [Candidatus Limosilactobacillus intestinigallinarum]|nr:hypothetical protein [Candidatus Limosilactobacillus intestinigallinarum]